MNILLCICVILNLLALFLFSKQLTRIEIKVDDNLRQIEQHLAKMEIDDVYYRLHDRPEDKP